MFTESGLSEIAKEEYQIKLLNIGWSFLHDIAYISIIVYSEKCNVNQIVFHYDNKLWICPEISENFLTSSGAARRISAYFEKDLDDDEYSIFNDNRIMNRRKYAILTDSVLEIYL